MTPQDVCRFLVWSDQFGKTQVHAVSCPFLGRMGVLGCACPTRLAAGTIQNMIQQMTEILRTHGRSRSWDAQLKVGNLFLFRLANASEDLFVAVQRALLSLIFQCCFLFFTLRPWKIRSVS